MTDPPAAELPFDAHALWNRVAALLDGGKTLQARTELLSTWSPLDTKDVTVGPDATRSPQAPVEAWPFWAFIGTLRVTHWHESLRPLRSCRERANNFFGAVPPS
jgi:hypothetical protein